MGCRFVEGLTTPRCLNIVEVTWKLAEIECFVNSKYGRDSYRCLAAESSEVFNLMFSIQNNEWSMILDVEYFLNKGMNMTNIVYMLHVVGKVSSTSMHSPFWVILPLGIVGGILHFACVLLSFHVFVSFSVMLSIFKVFLRAYF